MYLDYIDKEELLDAVRGAVQIKSVVTAPEEGKPFGAGSAEALNYALDLAKKMGFRTTNLDNMVGYAEYGTGDKMVAVLGHMDVVPEGEGWNTNPYELTLADGKLYGRGIADDKGPIISALFALDAVVKSGKPLKNRIRIIFGADEEVDCHDMERYMETEEIPFMAFTPDAEYPAIYGEKGIIHYSLKKRVKNLLSADGGMVVNSVPDKAQIKFMNDGEEYQVSGTGITAHGSTPHLGVNAIDNLDDNLRNSDLYEKMPKGLKEFFAFYEKYYKNDYFGEKTEMSASNADTGRNSSNVGMLSWEDLGNGEQEIKITCDFRFIPGYSKEEAIEKLEALAKGNDMTLEIFKERNALFIPKNHPLIKILQHVFYDNTGIEMEAVCMGGGTYAKCLPNTVAFGPLFPGDEDPIHQPNEYMLLDNLYKNTEIMAQAIYELATYDGE